MLTVVGTEISRVTTAYRDADPDVQKVVRDMLAVAVAPDSNEQERVAAELALLQSLFPVTIEYKLPSEEKLKPLDPSQT